MRQVGVGIVAAGGRLWVTEIFRRPEALQNLQALGGAPVIRTYRRSG